MVSLHFLVTPVRKDIWRDNQSMKGNLVESIIVNNLVIYFQRSSKLCDLSARVGTSNSSINLKESSGTLPDQKITLKQVKTTLEG